MTDLQITCRHALILFIFFCNISFVYLNDTRAILSEAEKLLSQRQLDRAIPLYITVLESDTTDISHRIEACVKLANIYGNLRFDFALFFGDLTK